MSTLSLDLVPPFLAVAELGSFSAAATRLGVEKSSVSRAIARLEDGVGEKLFLRTTRHVSLTAAGVAARDRLREPHAMLGAALKAVLEEARQPRGRLVVSVPEDFGAVILTDALARFVRRHPYVAVDVRLSNAFVDLAGSGVDVAIRIAQKRLADSTVKARTLGVLRVAAYASPDYLAARGGPRSPEEAAPHPWVIFAAFRELRFVGPNGTVVVTPDRRVTCDEMSFALNATVRGIGLGLLPSFLADAEVRAGRLIQILSRWTLGGGDIWFLTPGGRQKTPPAVEALRENILEVLVARGLTS